MTFWLMISWLNHSFEKIGRNPSCSRLFLETVIQLPRGKLDFFWPFIFCRCCAELDVYYKPAMSSCMTGHPGSGLYVSAACVQVVPSTSPHWAHSPSAWSVSAWQISNRLWAAPPFAATASTWGQKYLQQCFDSFSEHCSRLSVDKRLRCSDAERASSLCSEMSDT